MTAPQHHRVRHVPFFISLIKEHHGLFHRWLDVGCGELYSVWKKKYNDRYVGLDNRESIPADYHMDACRMAFRHNLFDLSTSWSTIEHVICPYDMLDRMKTVTSGTCILTTDLSQRDKDTDPTHLYSWTPKTFKQLLNAVHDDVKVYADHGMLIGVMYNCGIKET